MTCKKWFDGGAPADGAIKAEASAVHKFREGGGSNWSIYPPGTKREEKVPLAWSAFATSFTPNPITFGYKWNEQLTRTSDGLVTLPEYYQLGTNARNKPQWAVIQSKECPPISASHSIDLSHLQKSPKSRAPRPMMPKAAGRNPAQSRPVQSENRRWQHGHLLLVSLRRSARHA
jgi:hypothetical protein